MATLREIRKRIQSVTSTKKITKTMEMVATSKMKKMQDRLKTTQPFVQKTDIILSHLLEAGIDIESNPILRERAEVSKVLILLISGNRGLCGGFNSNLIDMALNLKDKLDDEGKEVSLYVMGKKAASYCKFAGIPVFKSMENPEDKFTFEEASVIGKELVNLFISGAVDQVYAVYTEVVSSSSQKAATRKLLPVVMEAPKDVEGFGKGTEYIFEPDAESVFSKILPMYLKLKIYFYQLESGFSEQFARRVAMKNATDAATDLIKELTVTYNRARQAKITNEIAEIVGGAAALE